jgi:hypothetical protein
VAGPLLSVIPEAALAAKGHNGTAFPGRDRHRQRPPASRGPRRDQPGTARDGSPLLLPRTGSLAAAWLAGGQETVRVSLPAGPPFSALRLTGTARLVAAAGGSGITACSVSVDSVEFTGAGAARVAVDEYRAAAPDPLWRVAPGRCTAWSTATWATSSAACGRTEWAGRSGWCPAASTGRARHGGPWRAQRARAHRRAGRRVSGRRPARGNGRARPG